MVDRGRCNRSEQGGRNAACSQCCQQLPTDCQTALVFDVVLTECCKKKKKKIQSVKRVVFVIKVHVHLWQLITLLLLI